MARKKNYINKDDMYEHFVAYKKDVERAKFNGLDVPQIPRYIEESFLELSYNIAAKHNFVGYDFIDEMIGDGILNCMMCVSNFNPEKSKNPFSYFTTVIWRAFLRRIAKEKKEMHTKGKMIYYVANTIPDSNYIEHEYLEEMKSNSKFYQEELNNIEKIKNE